MVSTTEASMWTIYPQRIFISRYQTCIIEMWKVRTFFRHLQSSANYIHEVVSHGGVILVNCYMGLSRCRVYSDSTMTRLLTIDYIPHCRSASCVLAYLIAHQNMTLDKVSFLI